MKDKILEIVKKHWTNHLYPMQNQINCASEIELLFKEELIHYQVWANNFQHEYGEKSTMQLVNQYFERGENKFGESVSNETK